MAVADVGVPARTVSGTGRGVPARARLSSDGRLLVVLLAVTLLGPYFPVFDWLGYSGFTTREIRADNILLPAVAAYVLLRCLATGNMRVPVHVFLYGVFSAWLLLVTVLWFGNVPAEYGGTPQGSSLLMGGDAYIRPLLMLFIAANARVSSHDLRVIVRLVLAVGVILALVAAAQLTPGLDAHVNPILAAHYDNSGATQHFWTVLNQGRVAALMPQLSTLGMYAVLVLGILGAQLLGADLVRSKAMFAALVAAVMVTGILSGSKVFAGGLLLLVALAMLSWIRARRSNLATVTATALAGIAVWIFVTILFPAQADMLTGRIPSNSEGFYQQYLAPRFEPESGKVYRTGAVDIASRYPLSGLGLNVVGRTTDSLLLGVVIMSGVVGAAFYLCAICAVGLQLYVASRSHTDPYAAGLSRMMLVLTVVFLVAAIGFHTFIQDRAGDAYWMLAGLLLGPLAFNGHGARGSNGEAGPRATLSRSGQTGPGVRRPPGNGPDTGNRQRQTPDSGRPLTVGDDCGG